MSLISLFILLCAFVEFAYSVSCAGMAPCTHCSTTDPPGDDAFCYRSYGQPVTGFPAVGCVLSSCATCEDNGATVPKVCTINNCWTRNNAGSYVACGRSGCMPCDNMPNTAPDKVDCGSAGLCPNTGCGTAYAESAGFDFIRNVCPSSSLCTMMSKKFQRFPQYTKLGCDDDGCKMCTEQPPACSTYTSCDDCTSLPKTERPCGWCESNYVYLVFLFLKTIICEIICIV